MTVEAVKPVADHPVREAVHARVSAHKATQNRPRSVGQRHHVHHAILKHGDPSTVC